MLTGDKILQIFLYVISSKSLMFLLLKTNCIIYIKEWLARPWRKAAKLIPLCNYHNSWHYPSSYLFGGLCGVGFMNSNSIVLFADVWSQRPDQSIGPTWVDSTWRRRQNPVSEKSGFD
jgi:hypothetical protein